MPGIYGIIRKTTPNREANAALLSRMRARLEHYREYVSEGHVDSWFAVGSTTIPFTSETRIAHDPGRNVTAAFGGYIYGFRDRDPCAIPSPASKAPRLIELYGLHDRALPNLIDGSFNVAVFDSTRNRALIGNDRMAHRQLYYLDTPELFLFAPEVKAILACCEVRPPLSRTGVTEYFNFGYPLGENTMFEGVKFLRGSHLIETDQGKVSLSQYWDFKYGEESQATIPELIEEADAIYPDVIKRRVNGYRRVLIPLSGGLDSRFIVGQASRLGVEIHSFTHGRRGCEDLQIAIQLAKVAGVQNYRFIPIDSNWLADYFETYVDLAEGMAEGSPCILLGISDQYGLPVGDTCFLNGIFGGPTNFGSGYFGPHEMKRDLTYEQRRAMIARSYGTDEMRQAYYALFTDDFVAELKQARETSIDKELARHLHVSDWLHHQKDVFLIRNRLTRYMNLVDCNRYRWHDHFALSDDRLLDFYIKLPSPLKIKRRFMIEYIRAKFPSLARVAYQATGVDLNSAPKANRSRNLDRLNRARYYLERLSLGRMKFYDPRKYAHQNQWYRSNRRIRDMYESHLLSSRFAQRGYFNTDVVRRLLRRQRLGGDSFYELTYLLSFELFLRRFVDSSQ
ncbi:MAG: asparagine synthase-related protein [Candidatus Zixiibacteriota bacterium]